MSSRIWQQMRRRQRPREAAPSDPNGTSERNRGVAAHSRRPCYLSYRWGDLPMKTHNWLIHVAMRTSGSARGAHRKSSTGPARAWTPRGILVLALVLGAPGAVAATSLGHGSAGQAKAHQPAENVALTAGAGPVRPGLIKMPWMY